jgi:glycosyltransferase involved in cell wall biosynthesis
MNVSVIICSHNPRDGYIRRTLDALCKQALPKSHWELLLIDNASNEHLSEKWDLSWHPAARHVREDELGLTHARLRGIREAAAELLVFVDDDNVLNSDFLSCALEISKSYPWVGIYGGSILGEYDVGLSPRNSVTRSRTMRGWYGS